LRRYCSHTAAASAPDSGSDAITVSALAGTLTVILPSGPTTPLEGSPGGFHSILTTVPSGIPSVSIVASSPRLGSLGFQVIDALPMFGIVPGAASSIEINNSVFPMRHASTVLVLLLCLLCTSCGTMLGGGPWMVPVSSSPAGATVFYDGSAVGRTPCQVAMHGHDLQLRLELDGHSTANVEVDTSINWWGGLNGVFLIPGILIGTTVDYINGNHHRVSTEPVYVSMRAITPRRRSEPAPAAASAPPAARTVEGNPFGPLEPIRMGITPGTRPWLEDDLNTPELPQPSAVPPPPPPAEVPPPPRGPGR